MIGGLFFVLLVYPRSLKMALLASPDPPNLER